METDKKYFVWNGLRISFWLMIALWGLIGILLQDIEAMFISLLFVATIISTFVFSIIHLVKYEEKAMAIVSLCISSMGILFFLIGVIVGIVESI